MFGERLNRREATMNALPSPALDNILTLYKDNKMVMFKRSTQMPILWSCNIDLALRSEILYLDT